VDDHPHLQRPGAHVLLTEDNPVNQRVATAMLSNLGFSVDVVGDGEAAVEAASSASYRAILMDCQLPLLDGYRATSEIRSRPGPSREAPIIAVTGAGMSSNRPRCLAAGMDDYLTKPISLRSLAVVLARWAPIGSDVIEVDPTETLPKLHIDLTSMVDPARPALDAQIVDRLERVGASAGEDLMGQVTILFLADAHELTRELREALVAQDATSVLRAAHTLSGASANIGATELARLSATLATDGAAHSLAGAGLLLVGVEAELERVRCALEARALAS
jgi:two-component system, sensor histidine kinase and response regulator